MTTQNNEKQTQQTQNAEDELEKSEEQEMEDKIKNAKFFLLLWIVFFCDLKSETLQKNVEHMEKEHGLFIPDKEYIVDLEGLICYLGEKVSVGNICLYCNGKGKNFYSLEAVRSHMKSLDHCKMLYDNNEEEYSDFYDFSRDYQHIPKQENEETEGIKLKPSFTINDAGHLVLDNGSVIGHRSYAVYYKQRIYNTDQTIVAKKLVDNYKLLGWIGKKQGRIETPEDLRSKNIRESKMQLKVGLINNFQKHYRNQTPY